MGKLADLMNGTVGYFWPDRLPADELGTAMPGHVRLGDDGQLLVEALTPIKDLRSRHVAEPKIPEALLSITSVTGAMFLDIRGVRHENSFGGYRPDKRQYRCGAVVIDAPVDRLRSSKLLSVTAFFPGLERWAGVSASQVTTEEAPDGRLRAWSVRVESPPPVTDRLSTGKELSLSTHWEVNGPEDRRVVYAPVALTVSSRRPASWRDLIVPLLAIQGLISLAFDGLILADGGRVALDVEQDGRPSTTPSWWTARLMRQPPGARLPKSMTEIPSFHLAHIGGVAGLRRWVALERQHPRAVGPVVSPNRFGAISVETRLQEAAAAIEYWVAVHRKKKRLWARKTRDGSPAESLALHIGEPFREFVGDPKAWARLFTDNYNRLKHDPLADYDPFAIGVLAESGALLLQCSLLNRAAASTRPARVVCQSHRYNELARRVKELLGG